MSSGAEGPPTEDQFVFLRDDQNSEVREPVGQMLDHGQCVRVSELQIQQEQIGFGALQLLLQGDQGFGEPATLEPGLAIDPLHDALAEERMVIHDEHLDDS
jgi:hypothetical protein